MARVIVETFPKTGFMEYLANSCKEHHEVTLSSILLEMYKDDMFPWDLSILFIVRLTNNLVDLSLRDDASS
jgi:hypothetical protein